MLSVSTTWNFGRHGALAPAVAEIAKLGFRAVELRAKGAVPDPDEAGALCLEAGVRCPSVHAPLTAGPWSEGDPSNDLASTDEARRGRAVAAVLSSLRAARAARAGVVVVHLGEVDLPGARGRQTDWLRAIGAGDPVPAEAAETLAARRERRDAHLDAAARSLFDLCRAEPAVTWALENRYYVHEIPDVEEVGLLLEDAGGRNVAYWHDTGHAHLMEAVAGVPVLDWLDRYGGRTAGLHLHDCVGSLDHLPPGGGEVDWPGVRGYVTRSMVPVLEVHGRHSAAELLAGADFARQAGFGGS